MIDITGMKFERLTVWEKDNTKPLGRVFWMCQCECGTVKSIESYPLRKGMTRSCGCLNIETAIKRNKVGKHLMSYSTEYHIYQDMKARCRNQKAINFDDYGGRGIAVCDRWLESFENFYEDMGDRPSKQHSLDRIDGSKGYSKENCRWATLEQQANNKSNNVLITHDERTMTIAQWARYKGMNITTLHNRLKKGMTTEEALNTPVRSKQC